MLADQKSTASKVVFKMLSLLVAFTWSLSLYSPTQAKPPRCASYLSFKQAPEKHTDEHGYSVEQILEAFSFPSNYALRTNDKRMRLAIYFAYGGRDFYTGLPLDFRDMTLDHVVPKSKGGPNHMFNYVPTAQKVNGRKGDDFDSHSAYTVLSLIRDVYSSKVLRDYDKLSHLSEKQLLKLYKSNDPRKLTSDRQDPLEQTKASLKRIRLVAPVTEEFRDFLVHLRERLKARPDQVKVHGPSVVVDLDWAVGKYTYSQILDFKVMSEVKTEIHWLDGQTSVVKNYPLLQSLWIKGHKNAGEYALDNADVVITRKMYLKLLSMSDEAFIYFLEKGTLVEQELSELPEVH